MNRNELVEQCKRLIAEAYSEATEMIVAYVEMHPDESQAGLCKEIDPDNWRALESRVVRLKQKRRSEGGSGTTGPKREPRDIRGARYAFRNPNISIETKRDLIAELANTPEGRKAIIEAVAENADVVRHINRRAEIVGEPPLRTPREPLDIDDWRNWIASQQEEFDTKTVKSARHLLTAAWLRSQGYVSSGEAEMLMSLLRPADLDAELDALVTSFKES